MTSIQFYVTGVPVPQGSKRAVYNVRAQRAFMVEDNKKTKPWRSDVMSAAFDWIEPRRPWEPLDQPLAVDLVFYFPRPKAHYRTGRNANLLRDDAPTWHTNKPDSDKLQRAIFDALTAAGVWRDDKLVADVHAVKRYCDHHNQTPGCRITIQPAGGTAAEDLVEVTRAGLVPASSVQEALL